MKKVTRETRITGDCIRCGEGKFCKTFRGMVTSGANCKKCQKISFSEKCMETNCKKRGVPYPMQDPKVREKGDQTNLILRGVRNAAQDPEVKEKMKQTNYKIRGVAHPMQDSEVASKGLKTSFQTKIYEFPSRKEISIMGYEHFALDDLLGELDYTEDDIIAGDEHLEKIRDGEVEQIFYIDSEGNQRTYFPDIFIVNENKFIEVKSTFTLKNEEDIAFLKQEVTKELGYNHVIWIYDPKGKLLEEI